MKKRYLVLSNGDVFEGNAFGADISSTGELVFATGMCGYIETLTDPSYYGQIVMQTFPLIGNYGIISDDFEGKCAVKGYAVREYCDNPSNFRCEKTLDEFLKENSVPGIYGIDTRFITRTIREHGVMNAMLCDNVPDNPDIIKNYTITDAVRSVSTSKRITFPAKNKALYRVALMDFGAKRNIARELTLRGCEVTVFPYDTAASEILGGGFDGVMLSNGPGDPAKNTFQINEIKKLLGNIPVFGICLGHQLMALAAGGKTVKLKYGHRGVNQPVKDIFGNRLYITSQNHGYAVVSGSVKTGCESFINANDKTNEGMDYPELNAFSVQFHPEACSGPKDTAFLFDRFCGMMGGDR